MQANPEIGVYLLSLQVCFTNTPMQDDGRPELSSALEQFVTSPPDSPGASGVQGSCSPKATAGKSIGGGVSLRCSDAQRKRVDGDKRKKDFPARAWDFGGFGCSLRCSL